MDQENFPTSSDLRSIQEYIDGEARGLHGMTFAQGLQYMLDYITGNGPRPDKEE